jgi:hypothetical protein
VAHELHRRNVLILAQQMAKEEGIPIQTEIEADPEH